MFKNMRLSIWWQNPFKGSTANRIYRFIVCI